MSDAFGASFHIGQLARILRRRWKLVACCALLAGMVAMTIGMLVPPRYTAKVQILLDPPSGDRPARFDDMTVQTWAELMSTSEHLQRLRESLESDPPDVEAVEYDRPLLSMLADRLLSAIAGWRGAQPEGSATAAEDVLPGPQALDARLKAFKERQSRVLAITFTWTDPGMAAAIANRSASIFLDDQLRLQEFEQQRTLALLRRRMAQARQEMDRAAAALSDYRASYGTTDPDSNDQMDAQIGEIRRQLAIATADLAASRQTDALQDAVAMAAPKPASTPGEVAVRSGLRSQLAGQPATSSSDVLEARIRYLSGRLSALQDARAAARGAETVLRDLRLEATAANGAYESLLGQHMALGANPPRPQASIVSVAVPPWQPSSPDPIFFIPPALVAGCIGGGLLAVLLQRLDRRVRSERQVEAVLGVPCIGVVPRARGTAWLQSARVLLRKPFAPYSKAIRSTAMAILGVPSEQTPGKVVLLTSSERMEGKTALAVSLGAYASLLRHKVLIVDLDLTGPSLAALLRASPGPDAQDVLCGAPLAEAVRRDETFGFAYLPLAADGVNPLMLTGGSRVRALLEGARQHYDLVIVDAAAVLGNPEVRVLVALADQVILTLKWGSTHLDTASVAVAELIRARQGEGRLPTISTVLTHVEPRLYPTYATWPEEDRGGRSRSPIAEPAALPIEPAVRILRRQP